jgi:dihydroxyacetone kinase-like predicted kinase
MATREHFGADDLRAAIATFRDLLRSHQDPINRLNVYPVPDGDTGTNMALTLESVVTELEGAGPAMADTCKAIGHGSLMGARGNSGVILCQVLRGLTTVLAEGDEVDGVT